MHGQNHIKFSLGIAIRSVVGEKMLRDVKKDKASHNVPLRNEQFVVIQRYTVIQETEKV